MAAFVSLIALIGFAGAVWRFVSTRQPFIHRFINALIPLSIAATAFMFMARVMRGPEIDWNESKLAPVVAMTKGYELYQNPDSGVMTGWIYGPVGAIILLPAALAHDPTTAVLIGVTINALVFLLPGIWLILLATDGAARPLRVPAMLAFGWLAIFSDALFRCAFICGADAPALGLAACAVAFIYRDRSPWRLICSATCAILCIWTKQNFLPLLAGLAIYVALVDGSKIAGIYLGMLAGIGLVISIALIAMFGASNMYFHMVAMPAGHPLRDPELGGPVLLIKAVGLLLSNGTWGLGLLTLALVLDALLKSQEKWRAWISERPWSLLLIAAISLVPGSLAGYMKAGGFLNNLGAANYFLVLAGLAAVSEVSSRPQLPETIRALLLGLSRSFLTICGFLLAILSLAEPPNGAADSWAMMARPYGCIQYTLFEYAKKRPQEVYCPWNTLTTLMVDGKLYHFEWGLLDRLSLQRLPSVKQFTDHLPARMNMIVYPHHPQTTNMQHSLLPYRKRIEVPELPGCVVITQ